MLELVWSVSGSSPCSTCCEPSSLNYGCGEAEEPSGEACRAPDVDGTHRDVDGRRFCRSSGVAEIVDAVVVGGDVLVPWLMREPAPPVGLVQHPVLQDALGLFGVLLLTPVTDRLVAEIDELAVFVGPVRQVLRDTCSCVAVSEVLALVVVCRGAELLRGRTP